MATGEPPTCELDSHFTKATQIAAQYSPASGGFETHGLTTNAKTFENPQILVCSVDDTGFDSPHVNTTKTVDRGQSGAHSGARSDADALLADDDTDLAVIVAAWPKLSRDVRQAVFSLIEQDSAMPAG